MKLFTLITGTVAVGLSMLLANVQVNAAPQPKTKLRPTKTYFCILKARIQTKASKKTARQ